jgi:hypothetical protein
LVASCDYVWKRPERYPKDSQQTAFVKVHDAGARRSDQLLGEPISIDRIASPLATGLASL